MKKDIMALWVNALRSGEYKKGRNRLKTDFLDDRDSLFCCLGVLCDLHAKETGNEWEHGFYLGDGAGLPREVREWAGLENKNQHMCAKLTFINDNSYKSFSQIANYIEENIDTL